MSDAATEHDNNGHQEHDHSEHPGMAHDEELGYYPRRAKAIEALLVEKGICSPDEIQGMVDRVERRSPADGARVVARAWADPEFKARLLSDPEAALAELGYRLPETTPKLDVVEKYGECPQPGSLHPLLLLSPEPAGTSPRLVQEPGLPVAGSGGPPGRGEQVIREFGLELGRRPGTQGGGFRRNRSKGVGQYRRPALPGFAPPTGRHRRHERN